MLNHDVTSEIVGEICIIGSGPAGMTLAMELGKQGKDVVLLEAGHDQNSPPPAVAPVKDVGFSSRIDEDRIFAIGGTSGHWGGWCAPLDKEDFEAGWPFSREELIPFYERAWEILNLGHPFFEKPKIFSEQDRAGKLGLNFLYYQFSTPITRFGEKYLETLKVSSNIRCFPGAPVVHMKMNENQDRVENVEILKNGSRLRVKCREFVFAAGTLENARLLSVFSKRSKRPIGLGHSWLGKGFMGHPYFANVGYFHLSRKGVWKELLGANDPDKRSHFFLQVHPRVRQEQGWVNLRMKIRSIEEALPEKEAQYRSFSESVMGKDFYPPQEMVISCEQVSDSESRIFLSDERDQWGLNLAKLDWKLTEKDWSSYAESMLYFAKKIPVLGAGELSLNPLFLARKVAPETNDHHMGLTRMGKSHNDGYVDKNLKVFGVDNLFIVGGSVFPAGGCVAPTFTIVSLALRLAEFLKASDERSSS